MTLVAKKLSHGAQELYSGMFQITLASPSGLDLRGSKRKLHDTCVRIFLQFQDCIHSLESLDFDYRPFSLKNKAYCCYVRLLLINSQVRKASLAIVVTN